MWVNFYEVTVLNRNPLMEPFTEYDVTHNVDTHLHCFPSLAKLLTHLSLNKRKKKLQSRNVMKQTHMDL